MKKINAVLLNRNGERNFLNEVFKIGVHLSVRIYA